MSRNKDMDDAVMRQAAERARDRFLTGVVVTIVFVGVAVAAASTFTSALRPLTNAVAHAGDPIKAISGGR